MVALVAGGLEGQLGLDLETPQQQIRHKDLMEKIRQFPIKTLLVEVVVLPEQDLETYTWVDQELLLPFRDLPKLMELVDRVVEELAQLDMLQGQQTLGPVVLVDTEETLLQEEIKPVREVRLGDLELL
jgi:hypothetical protein